ncbi:cell wall-binding repeat-containing protein [Xylanimonas protaetiae]|nr:cell wall-binding repeat-containing protein [Xylanimonas protaetiae]
MSASAVITAAPAAAAPHRVQGTSDQAGATDSVLPEAGPTAADVETVDANAEAPMEVAEGFQTVGVSWPADVDSAMPDLQVRVRDTDGAWGGWTHLERETDGPDRETRTVSSSPVYVGESDALEIATVDAALTVPSGVQVTTVSSDKVDAPAATSAGVVAPAGTTAGPTIITRSEWRAAPACAWPAASALKGAAVHHTDNANSYSSVAEAMQLIRNDQAYHQNSNGWCDIGYNFIVDKWGNIYEGAAGSVDAPIIGAHTGGFNTGTVGVAMLGSYTTAAGVTPSAAQQDGVAKIIGYRLAQYGVNPAESTTFTAASQTAGGRFVAGQQVVLPRVFAHRDTHQTQCPGDLGYAVLPGIRAAAAQYAGLYAPYFAGVTRLAGPDRYSTSAAISAATFAPGVPVAYVAVGTDFPDALSGASAAAAGKGPVLLVETNGVPSVVEGELRRLRPGRIVVLGSAGVVSDAVATRLNGLTSGGVTRLAGPDRYSTSAAISAATFAPGVPVAYVAVGTDFPDALSGASAAAAGKGPVLLVETNGVPSVVEGELRRLRPGRIVVLGSAGVVSDAVATRLNGLTSGGVTRLAGPDRYSTSAAISAATFAPGVPVAYVAVGTNFPDGLSGAPAAAAGGGPVLLVTTSAVPEVIAAELQRLAPAHVVVLGSSGVVSDSVAATLAGYARGAAGS